MAIVSVENLTFSYPQAAQPVLNKLSFAIEEGAFVTICGGTGCGKTTLLRMLKPELTPIGTQTGCIRYHGKPLADCNAKQTAGGIGFVMQQPEQQLVTDKVWHELAFGLENLGVPPAEIQRRIAETASYFGIADWFEADTATLSGGQKQLLNLAAVLVMQPDLLLLDEPTAQLDPIAADAFLQALQRFHNDLPLTIVLVEHRLDAVLPLSDRLLVLEQGALLADGSPRAVLRALPPQSPVRSSMPAATRLYYAVQAQRKDAPAHTDDCCPMTVSEGRSWLQKRVPHPVLIAPTPPPRPQTVPVLEWRHLFVRYGRTLPDVLSDFSLTVYAGEWLCLLGGNGAGKTTALSVAAGCCPFYAGTVRVFDQQYRARAGRSRGTNGVAMLPQDVQTLFLKQTVREELADVPFVAERFPFDWTALLDQHPYDLSGGQQQLLGLAKVTAARPRLLLLDEPTKGLDAQTKNRLLEILRQFRAEGMTIVCITHDMEFAAEGADRCAMLFCGQLLAVDSPRALLASHAFYTTAAHRIAQAVFPQAVTVSELAALCAHGIGQEA